MPQIIRSRISCRWIRSHVHFFLWVLLLSAPQCLVAQGRAYVGVEASDQVIVLDTSTNQIIAAISVGQAFAEMDPHRLASTPDGSKVYVVNGASGTVSVIDTARNIVVATIQLPGGPIGSGSVTVTSDGRSVYVAGSQGQSLGAFQGRVASLTQIDGATNAVVGVSPISASTSALPQFGLPAGEDSIDIVSGLAASAAGPPIYVTGDRNMLVIPGNSALQTQFLLDLIDPKSIFEQVGFCCGGLASGVVFSPDRTLAYVRFGGHVWIMEVATARPVGHIAAAFPSTVDQKDVALSPDGSVLVATYNQGVFPFTPGLDIIDLADGVHLPAISLGGFFLSGVSFTPDGTKAYVGTPGNDLGAIAIVDIDKGTVLSRIKDSRLSGADSIVIVPSSTPAPGSAVQLVDPVPSLLDAVANQNMSGLASGGNVVKGVAADGVSEVLVRIPAASAADHFTLSLLNDLGQPSSSSSEDGGLGIVGQQAFSSQVTTTAVSTPSGPMAFALYLAPVDFARASPPTIACGGLTGTDPQLSCRSVTIQVQGPSGNPTSHPVVILRPPVVLIHGVWSGASAWDFFSPFGTGPNGSDPRFRVYRVDYSQHAGDSVDSIERGAFDQMTQYISRFKRDSSIAAVQADVVTHSMGGLVARDMVLDPRFSSAENFSQGFIHKLITIGTPHNGSQLATQLLASSWLCKAAFGFLGKPVSGAVTDMSVGNSFLNFLNTANRPISIRAHAIVGIASTAQELASQAGFEAIAWGVSSGTVCSNLLPAFGGYESLFGGSSDLLVSGPSQSFGFGDASAVDTPSANMIHTVAPAIYPLGPDELNTTISLGGITGPNLGTPVNPNLVLDLLNTPVMSNAFVNIRP